MSRADKLYPEYYGKTLRDTRERDSYFWTCEWCGYSKNEGSESRCQNCDAVRSEV